VFACVSMLSCTENSTSNLKQHTADSNSKPLRIHDPSALKIVRDFSNCFEPDSSAYTGIGSLQNVPDSIIQAFKILKQSDTLSHKRYLIVIFLKLYLDHLRCCHQGYELRDPFTLYIDSVANPMLYEFNLATKMFDLKTHHEFINSGIAHTYVEKHKDLLMYPEIKEIMDKIKPVEDSIIQHLYWKDPCPSREGCIRTGARFSKMLLLR
jgi:hypothetical protein